MMGPMVILYEVSILISAAIYRKREEALDSNTLDVSEEPPSGVVGADGP